MVWRQALTASQTWLKDVEPFGHSVPLIFYKSILRDAERFVGNVNPYYMSLFIWKSRYMVPVENVADQRTPSGLEWVPRNARDLAIFFARVYRFMLLTKHVLPKMITWEQQMMAQHYFMHG